MTDDRMTDERALPTLPGEPVRLEAEAGSGQVPAEPASPERLRDAVIDELRQVHDPEIPVNIYDLGLIYDLAVDEQGRVDIAMTLTAPACPVAGPLVQEVADRVGALEGVSRAHVELVWDPPWTVERMTDAARLELGFW